MAEERAKLYYSISEVCDETGLKPHVLRYWETAFPMLHPSKNKAGNRIYRPEDIELVMLIKRLLYDEKFTVDGARRKLEEMDGQDGQLQLDLAELPIEAESLQEISEELRSIIAVLERDPMDADSVVDENGVSG